MTIIKRIQNEKSIIIILLLALCIRLLTLANYQNELTLFSDDMRYVITGVDFIKSGHITYGGNTEPTVFMMPGMAFLLGIIFKITGYTSTGLIFARVPFLIFGLLSILGVYLLSKRLFNKTIGIIAAFLLALSFPHIVIDNMFLTESPFTCVLIYFVCWTIRYCDTKKNTDFIILLSLYLIGLIFKPTIAALPIVFLPYFMVKKFPLKLIINRAVYAIIIILLFMMPWWIRNYQAVGEFLPFTGNQGDTKLLGTFQGFGYPNEDLNKINDMLNQKDREGEYKLRYFKYKEKGEIANQRISKWIKEEPYKFAYTFLIYKPYKIISDPYYSSMIFDIKGSVIKFFHRILEYFSGIGVIYWLFRYKKNAFKTGILLILLLLLYFIYVNSYYLALARYALYFLPFIFILSSYGVYISMEAIKFYTGKIISKYSTEI
ncbi:ArnT family glycosyltransferase [Paenibacillus sanguinis]|uniref:ArnT family glycosyltransferase n=1 Tax=Paenibacillus sanguinis TaxID=225906 RepID=UPI00036249BD|nr:glycosyltransferase family 39 protein [Paenibacillus sanguinis]